MNLSVVRTSRMKFETGQIVVHKNSQSRWIVLGTKPYDYPHQYGDREIDETIVVTAYCLYSGDKPDYWQPNQLDQWMMGKENAKEYNKLWSLL